MSIYEENGYKDRRDYLMSVAEEFGVPASVVFNLASVLGKDEDFDALITTIDDYSCGMLGGF